jgi:subtilase family serine protease
LLIEYRRYFHKFYINPTTKLETRKGEGLMQIKSFMVVIFLFSFTFILCLPAFQVVRVPYVCAQAVWPSSWIELDWDRNENGLTDDWRDVEYAYYQYDDEYLYLKLECYDLPGKNWPEKEGRYKWFVDFEGNMYYSGGNVYDAEFLLFVEDADDDGAGEMYIVSDSNNDNNFGEYEPWPPVNYTNYQIVDLNIGGWRIVPPNQIEMYINWSSIGTPSSYWLLWSTDQQNPNLDQSPTADRVDEEQPLAVHNVAAISQSPSPTIVRQGEQVTVQVVVENKGTQTESFMVTCYVNNTAIGTKLATHLAAGHQSTINFDWNTTGFTVGNYNILAWADSSSTITETNEEDNWCTSPATVNIQTPLIHDVAAISQVPDQTSVLKGTTVNVNVTLSNLGDFSETFNTTCFYSGNPIGHQTITDLAEKTSTSLIFTWNTTGVEPGTYYIKAMADSSNAIIEDDEENNNCTSLQTVTVYSQGEMGMLFVDKIKTAIVSGEDPPIVGFSTVYEMTIIVTNIGGSNVSNIIVNETISPEASFISVGTPSQGSIIYLPPPPEIIWDVGVLTPGANATLKFNVSVAPTVSGLIYVNHKEDLVTSGKDTLNSSTVFDVGDTDFTVTALIRDLAAVSQVPSSTIVCQNDTVTIYVIVRNLGNTTESFNVTCYYDSSQIDTLRVQSLAPNDETVIPFPWDTTGVAPGTYSITAEADSSEEVAETNETNNLCTSPSTVEIVVHDISVISQVPSPTTVFPGEIVTIEVIVKNEGTVPETFNVSCYYNFTLLEKKMVSNLEPNTTLTLHFFWNTTDAQPGTYYITSGASTVPGEKDTDDNACRSTTTVTVLPQYTLTILPYAGGETDPLPGNYTYNAGTNTTVTATPDAGYKFEYWLLDGSDAGSEIPIFIIMDDDHILQPVFTQITYELIITTTSGGITTPAPSNYTHDSGSSVPVTALPESCHILDHWELDGENAGSTNPYYVLMDTNHSLHAVFIYSSPPLSVSIDPLSASIIVGNSISFTSTVNGGTSPYTYQWYMNDSPVSGATSSSWTFTPSSPGIYYIYLEVTDTCNNTAQSETARISVSPETPPVGGYSVSFTKTAANKASIWYTVFLSIFSVVMILIRRKRK